MNFDLAFIDKYVHTTDISPNNIAKLGLMYPKIISLLLLYYHYYYVIFIVLPEAGVMATRPTTAPQAEPVADGCFLKMISIIIHVVNAVAAEIDVFAAAITDMWLAAPILYVSILSIFFYLSFFFFFLFFSIFLFVFVFFFSRKRFCVSFVCFYFIIITVIIIICLYTRTATIETNPTKPQKAHAE